MVLGDFFKKRDVRKEKFRNMQEEDRLRHIMEERKKSANERELEKIQERNRQDMIAEKLKEIRRQETREGFGSSMFFKKSQEAAAASQSESPSGGQLDRGTMLNQDRMFWR